MRCFCCSNQVEPDVTVSLDHFNIIKLVGEGSFGQVRLVQHKRTKQQFALKIISKDKCIRRRATQYIVAERQLMEQLSYPLIANLRYAFQDEDQLYMAMDFMPGGDLRQWLQYFYPSNTPLSSPVSPTPPALIDETHVRSLMADVTLAIHYLHQNRICHRDIKPENILLDANGHAHLSDFNIATVFETNQPFKWSKAGSLAYMAPEILSQQGYTTSIDWWSLGVVAFELLFGRRPFTAPSNDLLVKSILYQTLTFPDHAQRRVSTQCLNFITGLLQKSSHQRLNSDDGSIFEHPWFVGINWQSIERKRSPTPMYDLLSTHPPPSLSSVALSSESSPLSPTKKRYSRPISTDANSLARPVTEEAQKREWLEDVFLPYDYTNASLPPIPPPPLHTNSSLFNTLFSSCFSNCT